MNNRNDDKLADIRARHEAETPLLECQEGICFEWWQELHIDRCELLMMVDELREALEECEKHPQAAHLIAPEALNK